MQCKFAFLNNSESIQKRYLFVQVTPLTRKYLHFSSPMVTKTTKQSSYWIDCEIPYTIWGEQNILFISWSILFMGFEVLMICKIQYFFLQIYQK